MILYHGSNVVVEQPKILQSALVHCRFTGFEKLGGE